MSFFGDIFDTLTAPIRYTADFVGDVFSGQNVFDSVGQLALKDNANSSFGLENIVIKAFPESTQEFLKNDTLNTITLGVAKDHYNFAKYQDNANIKNQDITFQEARDYHLALGKNAALAYGGYAIGGAIAADGVGGAATSAGAAAKSAVPYIGAAGGAVSLGKGIASGDPSKIISGATTLVGGGGSLGVDTSAFGDILDSSKQIAGSVDAIGSLYSDAQQAAAMAAQAQQNAQRLVDRAKANTPPQVSGYSSNLSGFPTDTKTVVPLVLLGLGAAYFYLRRGKI